ncbi:ImmA/IrrE family metallo-endopeptidase [Megasphaera sp. WILCCON 0056]|uniref:ImmA/IrrE family metallo-endopeptidase n=1 Tax=Megasphaera sp. WILCCON 0056 TaxID=3345340 RepID=UPI003A7FF9C9
MAAVYIDISPAILDWLIKKNDLIGNETVYNVLMKWKKGDKKPTFNQIEQISKKMQIPLGYFFLENPPVEDCSFTEFRTVNSQGENEEPSANLVDTIDMMLNIQDWMRDYIKDMGQDKKAYVASCSENMPASSLAEKIRHDLNLSEDWMIAQKTAQDSFKFLRHRCQNMGILIMMNGIVGNNTHRPLDVKEFRAFTLVDDYVPLIFINAKDSVNGRLFSLLHEIVHIWIGINSIYNKVENNEENRVSPIEITCNAVAGELLVPHRLFISEWRKNQEPVLKKVSTLSKVFTCSQVVIARKALDTQYIQEDMYHKIVTLAVDFYKNSQEKHAGGDYYKTMVSRLDPQFIFAIAASAQAGRTSYSDVYRLTNTNRTTFKQIYQKMLSGEGGVNS